MCIACVLLSEKIYAKIKPTEYHMIFFYLSFYVLMLFAILKDKDKLL